MPPHRLPRLVLAGALFAAAALAVSGAAAVSAAHAQTPAPAAADPAVDKRMADSFMAALAADGTARDRWLEQHVAGKPFMPKAEFKPVMESLAKVPGLRAEGFNRRGRWLEIFVVRADGKAAEIDLDMDPADGTKIMGLVPLAAPGRYPRPLVSKPVGEAGLKAAIADRVKWAANRDDFSGAVLVTKGDRVIYSGAYGFAEKDNGGRITTDTRFHLGSMDKQFTAVAVGQLVEAGKLSLDTRLIEVLPDYPNRDAAAKITIRQLLTHTAGMGGLFDREAYQRDKLKPFTRVSELLPMFAAEPLQFEPGQGANYSNEGFVVLGAVVEKLSGQSWFDYVRANIFARAGMTHTGWPAIDEIAPGRAVGYRFAEDDPLGFGQRRPNWNFLGYRGNSCGGGYSTVGDMVKFLQALRAGKLLKPETVELFTTPHPGGLRNYGMGFTRTPEGARTVRGHDGGGAASGINSDAKMIWETGYAYAVMGNYDAPFAEAVADDIAKMLAAQP